MPTMEEQTQWKEQVVDHLEIRKAAYQLLVDFLGDTPALESLVSWRNHPELSRLSELSRGARRLREELKLIANQDLYDEFASLREEYRRLFSRGGELPVAPCETMYRASEHMIPKSYAQEVREMYADFSLYFKKMHGEPDDHIAVELEFMAVLIEKMLGTVMNEERYQRYMNGQRDFVLLHLKRWALKFGRDLEQHADHPIYKAIGQLLQDFLAREAEWAEQTGTKQLLQ